MEISKLVKRQAYIIKSEINAKLARNSETKDLRIGGRMTIKETIRSNRDPRLTVSFDIHEISFEYSKNGNLDICNDARVAGLEIEIEENTGKASISDFHSTVLRIQLAVTVQEICEGVIFLARSEL